MKILLTKWSFQYWNRDRKWLLEQFNFDMSDIWPCWIQREDTRKVSASRGNSPIIADSTVCQNCSYSDKLYVLKLPDRNKLQQREAFDAHFIGRNDKIYERVKCKRRYQVQDEAAFITLVSLTKHCKYEMVKGNLTRRRVIAGIRDTDLLEQFQLHLDLTLVEDPTQKKKKKEKIAI